MPSPQEMLDAKKAALAAGLPKEKVEKVFGDSRSAHPETKARDALDLMQDIIATHQDPNLRQAGLEAGECLGNAIGEVRSMRNWASGR